MPLAVHFPRMMIGDSGRMDRAPRGVWEDDQAPGREWIACLDEMLKRVSVSQ